MPQTRYYHHGRYYRPARQMHLLPPLSLVPAVDPAKHGQLRLGNPNDEYAVTRRWKSKRDREFRWIVRYISETLTGENVADLRFLCRDYVNPPEILEKPMNGSRLMAILEQQRLLAENSLFFLQTILYYISRADLYELVHEFRAKRQNDFRKMGVEIMLDINRPNERGVALSKDIKSFRRSLKPHSRFNNVDMQSMTERLADLKARMQSRLQKPKDRSYATTELPAGSRSDAGDSEWEDVDSSVGSETSGDAAADGGRKATTLSRSKEKITQQRLRNDMRDGDAKKQRTSRGKETLRLPDIKTKMTLKVTIKKGRELKDDEKTESDYEEGFEADDETLVTDNQTEVGSGLDKTLSLAGDSPVRLLGPSKPIANFTHRSSEFADLQIAGQQTYDDNDHRACIRDANHKNYNRQLKRHGAMSLNESKDVEGEKFESAILGQAANPQLRVPMKIRAMRKRFRKDSHHGGQIHINTHQAKKQRNPKASQTLPKLNAEATSDQTKKKSSQSSLARLKTKRSVPTHDPNQMNFLPDIYDKYARRSVSHSSSTTTTNRLNGNKK